MSHRRIDVERGIVRGQIKGSDVKITLQNQGYYNKFYRGQGQTRIKLDVSALKVTPNFTHYNL